MVDFRFERVHINDPRMEELYRLRYQVYCTECGFESPEDHPDGLEYDEYDPFSSQFCAIVAGSERIIGTVRIIHDSALGLPIEHHCVLDSAIKYSGDPRRVGEISRLAISKDFRRREIDKAIYSLTDLSVADTKRLHKERRAFEGVIVSGLYRCIYQESVDLGLTHWYAVMVKGLCGLLRRWGITWIEIGEQVEYHGVRGPYIANIADNVKQLELQNPGLLEKPQGWVSQSLCSRKNAPDG